MFDETAQYVGIDIDLAEAIVLNKRKGFGLKSCQARIL